MKNGVLYCVCGCVIQNPYLERLSFLAWLPTAQCFCRSNSLSLACSMNNTITLPCTMQHEQHNHTSYSLYTGQQTQQGVSQKEFLVFCDKDGQWFCCLNSVGIGMQNIPFSRVSWLILNLHVQTVCFLARIGHSGCYWRVLWVRIPPGRALPFSLEKKFILSFGKKELSWV